MKARIIFRKTHYSVLIFMFLLQNRETSKGIQCSMGSHVNISRRAGRGQEPRELGAGLFLVGK